MSASAAGVSILPVGASTPGNTPERLAVTRKMKSVPSSGRNGRASLRDDVFDLLRDAGDDQLEHGLPSIGAQREPPRREPAAGSESEHDGPGRHHRPGDRDRAEMEDDGAGERRRLHYAALRVARSATVRARRKPMKCGEQCHGAELGGKTEKDDRRGDTAQRERHRQEPAVPAAKSVAVRRRAAK